MREFEIGDRVIITRERQAEHDKLYSPGTVVKIYKPASGGTMIKVCHELSNEHACWCAESLKFDNKHRQPCACFECIE